MRNICHLYENEELVLKYKDTNQWEKQYINNYWIKLTFMWQI